MKLRLPLFLLSAVTTLCSLGLLSTTAQASNTEYVYTGLTGDFANRNLWKFYDGTTWQNGYTNNIGTTGNTGFNSINGWASGSVGPAYNNTMRFMEASAYQAATGATLGANKAMTYTMTIFCFGGITVDQGAVGYSVASSGTSGRSIQWTAKAGQTAAVFDINENFSLSCTSSTASNGSNILVSSDVDMILSSSSTVGGAYTGPASVFTVNGKIAGGAGKRIQLSGGGTLTYNWSGAATTQTLAANWVVTESSLLNLAGNTTLANVSSALGTGEVQLNGGNIAFNATLAGTLNQSFVVSGASSLSAGAGLKFSNMTLSGGTLTAANGLNIDNGTLSLNVASSTVAGNITFSGNSTVSFLDLAPVGVTSTGVLDFGANILTLNFALGTQAGTYTLFSAGSFANIDLADIAAKFNYMGLGARQRVDWSGSTSTSLIADIQGAAADLVWAGGNGSWGQGLTTDAVWESAVTLTDYHFQQYDNVTIGKTTDTAATTGTLTLVSDVEVGLMTVTGAGNYTLAATGAEKITGLGSLIKEGTGTFRVENANTYSGGTTVKGGTLQVANSEALGSAAVTLEGGTLSLENTIANNIVFNGGSLNIANDMSLAGTFSSTTGGSSLINVDAGKTLSVTYSQINALPLVIGGEGTVQTSVSAPVTFTGPIQVNGGATFQTTQSASGAGALSVNGVLSGDGTVELISTYATTASNSTMRFSVAANNTAFTGTMAFKGTWDFSKFSPTTGSYHDVVFSNYQSFGSGTVRIENMGFYMNSANTAATKVAATIEIVGEVYFNGNSNTSYYFTDLAGSGHLTTSLGGNGAYWTGDLTQFSGTLSSAAASYRYNFGSGGAATLVDGKLFADGATLTGRHATNATNYAFNYSNDVEMNADLVGRAYIDKQGTGTMTIAQANNYVGGSNVSAGTLKATHAQALGTGGVTVNAGATLALETGATSINNAITNNGTVSVASGTSLVLTTYTGNANSRLVVQDNASLQGKGTTLGNSVLVASSGTIKSVGAVGAAQTTEFNKAVLAGTTLAIQNSVLSGQNASFNVEKMALEASVVSLSGNTTAVVSASNIVKSAFGDLTGTSALFGGDAASALTMTGTLSLEFGADFFAAWQAGDSMSINLFDFVDSTKLDLSGLTEVNFKVIGATDPFLTIASGADAKVFTYLQESGTVNVYFQQIPTDGAVVVIPEPSSATLGLVALSGLLLRRRRRA